MNEFTRSNIEDPFKDIDGALILEMLPGKIAGAARLVAEVAIDLAAAQENPDVRDVEVLELQRLYRARKFQLDALRSRLDSIEHAASGKQD